MKVRTFSTNIIRFIFCAIITLLAPGSCHTGDCIRDTLVACDTLLTYQPQEAKDRLIDLNPQKFTEKDRAYYGLLLTIAQDKVNYEFSNDSLIAAAVTWYKTSNEVFNYARALLYHGIVLFNIHQHSVEAFNLFKAAEAVMDSNNMQDNGLKCLLYAYLGDITLRNKEYKKADSYYEKGLYFSRKAGNYRNYVIALMDFLFTRKLVLKDEAISWKLFGELMALDSIPADLLASVTQMKAVFHKTPGATQLAIYQLIGTAESVKKSERSKYYYTASKYAAEMGQVKAGIEYGEACVKAIVDSTSADNALFYRYIASLYSKTGEWEKAAEYYAKSIDAFYANYYVLADKRIKELELKYETTELQQENARLRYRHNAYILCAVVLLLLVIFLSGLVYHKAKISRKEKEVYTAREDAERNLRFLVMAVNNTIGLLPEFIDKVNETSCKTDGTVYEAFQQNIKDIKKESRQRFSEISNDPLFNELFDAGNFTTELSDREKLIQGLSEKGFSTEFIASLLNLSPSSVRAGRSAAKKKLKKDEDA